MRRAGIALSVLAILFLAMDAGGKLIAPALMIANTPPLGIPADIGFYRTIGAVLALATLLYAWPRTAVLGAVLITGFLGGAIAMNVRVAMPLFGNTLFGVYLGLAVWGGLWLRSAAVRQLLPVVRSPAEVRSKLGGRIGIGLMVLFSLFMAMSIYFSLTVPPMAVAGSVHMGWPTDPAVSRMLGVLMLIGLALYLYPRTAVLGAVILTGYLGGAIAAHARIGDPLLSDTLFGLYLGMAAWAGLWLRSSALRALMPLRN